MVAILTIGLGIAATGIVFSIVDSSILRPLPYPRSDRLVQIGSLSPEGYTTNAVTGLQLRDWQENSKALDSITLIQPWGFNVITEGKAERVIGANVSACFLRVFQLAPVLGQGFDKYADRPGFDRHVVMLDI